uniref:Uncharacterized protein n=1 Tax=Arundo donax TaxID=35708 RepID=A0A0A9D980_ARUDO
MLSRQNGKHNQRQLPMIHELSLCICFLQFLFLNFKFSFLSMLSYATSKCLIAEIQRLHKVLEPDRIRCLQTLDGFNKENEWIHLIYW